MGRDTDNFVKGAAAGAIVALTVASAAHISMGSGKKMKRSWNKTVKAAESTLAKAEQTIHRALG